MRGTPREWCGATADDGREAPAGASNRPAGAHRKPGQRLPGSVLGLGFPGGAGFAERGTFLVDRDGIVRWANIECATEGLAGLGKFPSEADLLAAARALRT